MSNNINCFNFASIVIGNTLPSAALRSNAEEAAKEEAAMKEDALLPLADEPALAAPVASESIDGGGKEQSGHLSRRGAVKRFVRHLLTVAIVACLVTWGYRKVHSFLTPTDLE